MKTKKVLLPKKMNSIGIYSLFSQMFDDKFCPLANSFEIDFQNLEFIEPTGVASLANAAEFAISMGSTVRIKGPDKQAAPIKYLDDSRFFQLYTGNCLTPLSLVRPTTVPLQRVDMVESHSWLDTQFIAWLASRLSMPASALASIKACMQELFNNIQDHSGIDIGCIFIQHYPARNEIVISLADFGCGIPKTMETIFPGRSDNFYIQEACREGVSSRRRKGNMGVGLDLLIRQVVGTNRGRVAIRSGRGHLACYPLGADVMRVPTTTPGACPGTLIEVKLKTDTLVPDDAEREDLEW